MIFIASMYIPLGVIPVFSDQETRSYVEEQKRIEFYDLKHALGVMGRLEHEGATQTGLATSEALAMTRLSTSSTSCQSSSPDVKHTPTSSQPLPPSARTSLNHQSSVPVAINTTSPNSISTTSGSTPKARSRVATELPSGQVVLEHRALPQQESLATPRDFVTIFLLENNCLLSTAVNQMKQDKQVYYYNGTL